MLTKHVQNFVKENNISSCLLGLSGGVDSVVLFFLLLKSNIKLRAVYVNHSLSENGTLWGEFCEKLCKENNVKFFNKVVDAKAGSRESTEAVAREKRYGVYDDLLEDNETLMLAQHSDDQVETVLLQLLRGTGLSGLSGMPIFKDYKNGFIARPFLSEMPDGNMVTKELIENFALQNDIKHIFDESNLSNEYKRNYLRNEVIPNLKKEFGNINKTISRTAINCKKAAEELNSIHNDLFLKVKKPTGLSIKELNNFSIENIISILRYWMNKVNNQRNVSEKQILELVKFIMSYEDNNTGKFDFSWDNYTIKASKGMLYAINNKFLSKENELFEFKFSEIFNGQLLGDSFIVNFVDKNIEYDNLIITNFLNKRSLYIDGKKVDPRKIVKKYGFPNWEIYKLPIVIRGENLIAVGNRKVSKDDVVNISFSNLMY